MKKPTKTIKVCYFCKENIQQIDYKEADLLKKFITPQAKIASKKRTGTCSKHQRDLANAIKNARILSIIPFVTR